MKRYSARKSGIHGKGVFALTVIMMDELIAPYKGERISLKEVTRRTNQRPIGHTMFASFMDNDNNLVVIDGAIGGNSMRYINHGCEPNCEFRTDGKNALVYALREIQPGEELLLNYSLESVTDEIPEEEIRFYDCKCGSTKCTGTMLGRGKLLK